MSETVTEKLFPIQGGGSHGSGNGQINRLVYMRAYEVYCECFGARPAMVEGWCRGGFGKGELVAFLYASGFPRSEWKARVDEAFQGMSL